jgi:cell wall assembly regulator SMI1
MMAAAKQQVGLSTLGMALLGAVLAFYFVRFGLSWLVRSQFNHVLVPTISEEEIYPKAVALPQAVPDSIESLLNSYEIYLRENVPKAFESLNPGLSDEQITELEKKHDFVLNEDMRALYRWHNGSKRDGPDIFSYGFFNSLENAILERDSIRAPHPSENENVRKLAKDILKHRTSWLSIFPNRSGDGLFFDPDRTSEDGNTFFTYHDDYYFRFYPSVRNFIAENLEYAKTGMIKLDRDQLSLDGEKFSSDDFERIESKYSSAVP